MSKVNPDLAGPYRYNDSPYGTHRIILRSLRPCQTVLDVGCGPGYLARHCSLGDMRWYGLDVNPTYIKAAAPYYEKVQVCDLQALAPFPFADVCFDVMLFADVLEHLVDPVKALCLLLTYLTPRGQVIISLPNVAHISVRASLLRGRFDYTDSGILDRTHLHLYTIDSARDLARECGLMVTDIRFSSNRFGPFINRWKLCAGLLAYNIVLYAEKR